jgi:hypothetical protein
MFRNRFATFAFVLASSLPTYSAAFAQDATTASAKGEELVGTVTVTGPQLGDPAGAIQIHVSPLKQDGGVLTVGNVSAAVREKLLDAAKSGKSVTLKGSVSGGTINVTSAKVDAVAPLTLTDDAAKPAAADAPFHGLGPVKPPVPIAEPKVGFDQLQIHTSQLIGPGGVPPTSTLTVKANGDYTLTTTGDPALGQKTQTYQGQLSADQMKSLNSAFKKASDASLPKEMPGLMPGGPEFTITMTSAGKDQTVQGAVAGQKAGQGAAEWAALQPLLSKLESVQTQAESAPPTAIDPAKLDRGFDRTIGLSGKLTDAQADAADKADGKDAASDK